MLRIYIQLNSAKKACIIGYAYNTHNACDPNAPNDIMNFF